MMTPLPKYRITFHERVIQHLRGIDKKFHSEIRRAIEKQLLYEPDRKTRNRKPLENKVYWDSEWELRCGMDNQFRIFYRVHKEDLNVNIIAIGEKKGNRLLIEGEEYQP